MNSLDKMEDYDRLESELKSANEFITKLADLCESHEKQIEQLNAKVAMMSELHKKLESCWYHDHDGSYFVTMGEHTVFSLVFNDLKNILSTTEADVQSFINGVKAHAFVENFKEVVLIYKNESGQISIKNIDGTAFDMSKHVGKTLYEPAPKLRGE